MKRTIENIAESYNTKAQERDSSTMQAWKVKEREVFLDYIQSENVNSLLEIGAGPGKDSLFFKEKGLNTFSTDISPEMIKLCKEKGLNAQVMSFSNLVFSDKHFDSIWAMNCLLHVSKEDIQSVLNEIKRVLTPNGLFYLGVYGGENSEGIWQDDAYIPKRFFSFYEDHTLKELLSKFFIIEYFNVVPKEIVGGTLHFQSVILRNK
ncbi:class I SAM-dependent methyltransferase [Ornithinibacillus sp. BX22]|uniref:Class I SAM-dependent methyltransferase n=1 Tax=Ornithinibacillus hominis TaxID=2763055 RepID=A0A923RKC6_9BACI|nr:class I SAM-dependent methyltransferase [Ornithinibacillus hominis]MBC5638735.1 class I SAM-dependent methyltransferase [Ornithinibacillus hominis]